MIYLAISSISLFTFAEGQRPMAEMHGGCDNYKIDIKSELQAWKTTAPAPPAAVSGDTAPTIDIGKKLNLALAKHDAVKFLLLPEKTFPARAGASFAGLVKVAVPKDGTYRISLGEKLWVDVVDAATSKRVIANQFEMQTECHQIFKVVDFPLKANKSYILQISSSRLPQAEVLVSSAKYY